MTIGEATRLRHHICSKGCRGGRNQIANKIAITITNNTLAYSYLHIYIYLYPLSIYSYTLIFIYSFVFSCPALCPPSSAVLSTPPLFKEGFRQVLEVRAELLALYSVQVFEKARGLRCRDVALMRQRSIYRIYIYIYTYVYIFIYTYLSLSYMNKNINIIIVVPLPVVQSSRP